MTLIEGDFSTPLRCGRNDEKQQMKKDVLSNVL